MTNRLYCFLGLKGLLKDNHLKDFNIWYYRRQLEQFGYEDREWINKKYKLYQ